MMRQLKRLGRRIPFFHHIWGMLRWYATAQGRGQVAAAIDHLGWTVQCPICGWRGSSFYPLIHPASQYSGDNELCPRCQCHSRHRLLLWYLKERTAFTDKPSGVVLEVGPSTYSYRLAQKLSRAKYVTLDYASKLAAVRGDVTRLPFLSQRFDLMICFDVLEHVPDDYLAMTELRRVLKADGLCLIHVPIDGEVTIEDRSVTDPQERLRLFNQEDHVRSYGYDIADRLASVGFAVEVERYAARLSEEVRRRHGLPANDILYVCRPSIPIA